MRHEILQEVAVNIEPHISSSPVQARSIWSRRRVSRREVSPGTVQRLCDLVMATTATAFALPVGELTAETRRSAYAAFARQTAMYLAHVAFGLTYSEIGRGFRRDRKAVTHACA